MSKEGLIEAARFSWNCQPANRLLCDGLFGFVRGNGGHDEKWIVNRLKELYSYFYYLLIAQQNGISDPFDLSVVQAHWIGSDLLRVPTRSDMEKIFQHPDVKLFPAEKMPVLNMLANALLKSECCPHHGFHATIQERLTPDLIRQGKRCFVECGTVVDLQDEHLVLQIGKVQRKSHYGFMRGKLHIGDQALLHLDGVRRLTTDDEKSRLEDWNAATTCALKVL